MRDIKYIWDYDSMSLVEGNDDYGIKVELGKTKEGYDKVCVMFSKFCTNLLIEDYNGKDSVILLDSILFKLRCIDDLEIKEVYLNTADEALSYLDTIIKEVEYRKNLLRENYYVAHYECSMGMSKIIYAIKNFDVIYCGADNDDIRHKLLWKLCHIMKFVRVTGLNLILTSNILNDMCTKGEDVYEQFSYKVLVKSEGLLSWAGVDWSNEEHVKEAKVFV